MAVFLLVLKIVGYCLLGAVALLVAALFVPLRAEFSFGDGGSRFAARYACFSLRPKSGEKQPEKSKREKKTKKRSGKSAGSLKNTFSALPTAAWLQLLRPLKEALARILRSIKIRHLRVLLPVSGPDAAATAIAFGTANAAAGAVFGRLQRIFDIQADEFRVVPDFAGAEKEGARVSGELSARPAALLLAAVILFIRFLQIKNEYIEKEPDNGQQQQDKRPCVDNA